MKEKVLNSSNKLRVYVVHRSGQKTVYEFDDLLEYKDFLDKNFIYIVYLKRA